MTISEKNIIVREMRYAPFCFVAGFAALFFSVIWVRLPLVFWPVGLFAAALKLFLDFLSWRSPSKWIWLVRKLVSLMIIILPWIVLGKFQVAEYSQFIALIGTGYFFSLSIFRDRILCILQLKADHTY